MAEFIVAEAHGSSYQGVDKKILITRTVDRELAKSLSNNVFANLRVKVNNETSDCTEITLPDTRPPGFTIDDVLLGVTAVLEHEGHNVQKLDKVLRYDETLDSAAFLSHRLEKMAEELPRAA